MVLVGKITQNDTGLVTIDRLIQNETLANITATIREANPNTILLTSDIEIFNNENPPRWEIADSAGNKYSVTPINRKEAEIVCFDASGTPVTNILNGCLFEI